ncbi:MAG: hypothetical protein UC384_09185, partial [Lachnospira sp.]|nr:hypothetical protein [Lachnospira sp.]
IYIVVMILSIVTFGAYKINTAMGGNPVFSTIYRFAVAGAVIALIVMFIITLVMSILRYRNNLLKDEGYLMHTLPVSAASLHFSKMIASIIWFAADFIVLMLSIGFITGDLKYSWIKKLKMFMSAETDGTATGMVISGITGTVVAITVLYIIISIISALSTFYVCLDLGSLSYSSKGIMAFVWYIILYFVGQILSLIGLVILCIIMYGGNFMEVMQMPQSDAATIDFVKGTFIMAGIISVILIIVYNFISIYILDRKLNLE